MRWSANENVGARWVVLGISSDTSASPCSNPFKFVRDGGILALMYGSCEGDPNGWCCPGTIVCSCSSSSCRNRLNASDSPALFGPEGNESESVVLRKELCADEYGGMRGAELGLRYEDGSAAWAGESLLTPEGVSGPCMDVSPYIDSPGPYMEP